MKGFTIKTLEYVTVIPKQNIPSVEQVEPYSLIPQWAIAVIVIGMASLIFVILFGVAVVS